MDEMRRSSVRRPEATEALLESEAPRLGFSVLGPVRAWHGERPLDSGSPQMRATLAVLLLRLGSTLTAEELIDALWGEERPSRALAALRTYVSRLRKTLGADVLVSESGGYVLRIPDENALDLTRAQALAVRAEEAVAGNQLVRARGLYDEALCEWDGESLSRVPGPFAETQRVRLEEWRLSLLEHRLALYLRTGMHTEAVGELTSLTGAHPLRERLRELLMLALYRSGRQAEALAVYADTRRLLAEELGVDPRPELSELQQRILQADEELAYRTDSASEAPTTDASTATVVRPAQLPATVADFTGRDACVSTLSGQLAAAKGAMMPVSVVHGAPGVGKSTLAVHAAHRSAQHFPDGQLYVDLQGTGPSPADPEQVLGSFLRALGTPDAALPDGVEERSALYRSVLAGRSVLILLDNARDVAQIRQLLPGTEGCAALVTSRTRLGELPGARLMDLDVMTMEEALTLFTGIVGEERVAGAREAARDIVAACARLPVALRIAASRLATRRTWTVHSLASKLSDERRRLDQLQSGDHTLKAVFDPAYGQLEAAQARAFRLLGLLPGPDISLHAAAAALDIGPEETEALLESLVDRSLLEPTAPGRYRFHDLLRLHARACAERDEHPPSELEAVHVRLLDFHLSTAAGAYALERPGDRTAEGLAGASRRGLAFTDREAAREWLFTEGKALIATARQGAATGRLRESVDLLVMAEDLAASGAEVAPYEAAATALRDAAEAAADARVEARARTLLARTHVLRGDFRQADEEARAATALSGPVGDAWSLGNALDTQGLVAFHESSYAAGESHLPRP